MSSSNTALKVSDLDFFKIKDNLKNYLRSQQQFTDYDFDGSGMSVLLDLLAYNTYYNSFYLNMAANEAFLDTAQVRENILSHAKLINYVPTSPRGSIAKVNVKATPSLAEDNSINVITLDKYTRLIGQDVDGENYSFVTINSNTSAKVNGTFTFANVWIKQGEVITHQYEASSNNVLRRYQIPSANVDTSTLIVTVQASSTNTYMELYNRYDDITLVTNTSKAYFIEEDHDLFYTVYFGDNIIGKNPPDGSIINITYIDTLGSVANNISKFSTVEYVGNKFKDNVIVTTVAQTYGGSDKEDIEQIRFRAPYFYAAQNRCVTVSDYESLVTKDYPNIDAISVWGGEQNDPVIYGKVFMSIKTKGYYVLSNAEKEEIKNNLIKDRNVVTIIPEIVDPEYVFIQIRGKVYYDPTVTYRTSKEIQDIVKDAILKYTQADLNKFTSTFRKSKLQYYIENAETSITASDISVFLQRRIPISTNVSRNYTMRFNTPLRKGDFFEKLFSYPEVTVSDESGTSRRVFIEEVPDSYSGVDSIDVLNAGVNYFSTPVITIEGDGIGATAVAEVVRGRISKIKVTNRGTGYSAASVVIASSDGSQGQAKAILQARNGTLRTYYYKANGERVIVNSNAGTVNYDTGEVTLVAFLPLEVISNDFYEANYLTVSTVPELEVIPPLRNRILSIDNNNIQSIQLEIVAGS